MALDAHTHRQTHTHGTIMEEKKYVIISETRTKFIVVCRAIAYFSCAFIHRLRAHYFYFRLFAFSYSFCLALNMCGCTMVMIMIEIKDEQTRNRKQNIDLVGKCRYMHSIEKLKEKTTHTYSTKSENVLSFSRQLMCPCRFCFSILLCALPLGKMHIHMHKQSIRIVGSSLREWLPMYLSHSIIRWEFSIF